MRRHRVCGGVCQRELRHSVGDAHLTWLARENVRAAAHSPRARILKSPDSVASEIRGGEGGALQEGAAVDRVDAAGHEAARF
jgi:hypothetical protein